MFRRKPAAPVPPPEWLIVGLGNPGPEYRGTRHNVGFEVIDALSERHKIRLDHSQHQARFGIGMVEGTSVVLIKPLTFMNLSGQAVAPLARKYNVPPERILVVADDLDLAVGRNRLKPSGSAGGHNGHKSLIHSLGTDNYPRLKIGIGAAKGQTIDYVLGSFKPDERELISSALLRAIEGVEVTVGRGLEVGLNVVNVPQSS